MITTRDSDGAAEGSAVHDLTSRIRKQLLGLSAQHFVPQVCVVRVHGELDMLTAPLLGGFLREQLKQPLPHLVVDLHGVSYLGCSGLSALLRTRELARAAEVELCLAGLAPTAVGGSLAVASLLPMLGCYRTLAQAMAELLDHCCRAGALVDSCQSGSRPGPLVTVRRPGSPGMSW